MSHPFLFIAERFGGLNGGELSPLDILEGLCLSEPAVAVLTKQPTGPPRDARHAAAAPLWLSRNDPSWNDRPGVIPRALHRLRLRREVRRHSFHGALVEGERGHRLLHRYAPRVAGTRALVVRGSPDSFDARDAELLANLRKVVPGYPVLVSPSESVLDAWRNSADCGDTVPICLPNSCREDEVARIIEQPRTAVRKQLGLSQDCYLIVCLASIQPRKGQDLLLDLWPELRPTLAPAELHLVGPISARGGSEIAERARSLCGVHVAGPRYDALEYLYAADLMVLPSRSEASPRAILEAMALGTPIVATNVAGIPEQIRDGREGRLVASEDRDALGAAIRELHAQNEVAESFAVAARARYWQHFSRRQQRERIASLAARLRAL